MQTAAELGLQRDDLMRRLERHAILLKEIKAHPLMQAEAAMAMRDCDAFIEILRTDPEWLSKRLPDGSDLWRRRMKLLVLDDMLRGDYETAHARSQAWNKKVPKYELGEAYASASQCYVLGCMLNEWREQLANWQKLAAHTIEVFGPDDPRTREAAAWRDALANRRAPGGKEETEATLRFFRAHSKYGPTSQEAIEATRKIIELGGSVFYANANTNAVGVSFVPLASHTKEEGPVSMWRNVQGAEELIRSGSTGPAAAWLGGVLDLSEVKQPDHPRTVPLALRLLAGIMWESNQKEKALELIEKCIERTGQYPIPCMIDYVQAIKLRAKWKQELTGAVKRQ